MRIISRKILIEFSKEYPEAKGNLDAWFKEAENDEWRTPDDVKAKYRSASILKDGRIVFNICGNNFRLVVWIKYDFHTIYIRFVGTHKAYDKIDAQVI